jgi:PAS domain S-box-containing protein
MPPTRHRAVRSVGLSMRRAVGRYWSAGAAATIAVLATALVTDRAGQLPAVAAAAGAAGACAVDLIRRALRIHRRAHSFGPCRGAGFLGLGTALASATTVALAAGPTTTILHVATVATAGCFVAGLMLLPDAAPTLAIRLRHALDGVGIGCAVFLVVWLLLFVPPGSTGTAGPGSVAGPAGPAVAVGVLTSVALAVTVVTGARAMRHRRSALMCAAGAAVTLSGLALAVLSRPGSDWTAAIAAVLVGPVLIVAGARRSAGAQAARAPAAGGSALAAHPLFAVPIAAAIGVVAYHAFSGGRFDPVAVAAGLGLVTAAAARETLAALDVRRYAGRLSTQQARFRTLVAGSADVTMVLDTDLVVRWQSPAAARQFGLSDQDVLDRPFTDLIHIDDVAAMTTGLAAALTATPSVDDAPVPARLRDGFGEWRDTESTIRDLRADPDAGALVVHVRDVGELTGLRRRLDEATRVDGLTGLPTGRRLIELTASRMATGRRGALVVVSPHGLAGVNELHGTAVGDELLVAVTGRIRAGCAGSDEVARLDGDRFAVLMDTSALRGYPRAERLLAAMTEPYELSCGPARITADAGVADLHSAVRAEDVLRHATIAADRARGRGPGRVEGYDDGLAEAFRRRATIEQRLGTAIRAGEFSLVYQPVLDLRQRQPVAVEALLRWRLPDVGPVPPAEVVAAAEEIGCVEELDLRVVRRACRQLAQWRRDGRDLAMAVNISPRQISGDGLADIVADALRRNDLPADRLIVEVAARDVPAGAPTGPLAALRELGVRVALDHFGTAPVGLAQLPRLPVDLVKFDRTMFADPRTALVDVVVSLGARLGFEVAAVGVENDDEVGVLLAAGCHTAQGHGLAAPGHPERIEAFLEERRARLL